MQPILKLRVSEQPAPGIVDGTATNQQAHPWPLMIPTTLTNLILFNLCGLLALLGLLWVSRIVRWRWREHRRRRHAVVCCVCGHRFQDSTRQQAVECPGCHRLVQRQEVLEL